MSKESYARGFCKVAAAYGVDAVQLAKLVSEKTAQAGLAQPNGPTKANANDRAILNLVKEKGVHAFPAMMASGLDKRMLGYTFLPKPKNARGLPAGLLKKTMKSLVRPGTTPVYLDEHGNF